MSYEEPALFMIVPNPSWPFVGEYDGDNPPSFLDEYSDYRSYGRMVTLPYFTDHSITSNDPREIYSYMEFSLAGQAAVIYGDAYLPGTVVLCQRINHQWYVITNCFVACSLEYKEGTATGIADGTEFSSTTLYTGSNQRMNPEVFIPYTIEVITTGENKAEFDGLYTLVSYFDQLRQDREYRSYGAVSPMLKKIPGLSMVMAFSGVVYDDEYQVKRTLTVTHDDITETVYEGHNDELEKVSGDDTLPDSVYYRYAQTGNSPLWFELDTESEKPVNGLYTLWPVYWDGTTNASYAISKGYIHLADGTQEDATTYTMGYNASTEVFTISVTTTGDSFTYTCDLADFSFVNGERMTFTLGSDMTASGDLPQTITVRRPKNGFNRAVREADQQ